MMLRYAVYLTFFHMLLLFECCIGNMFIFCNPCTESNWQEHTCAKTVFGCLHCKAAVPLIKVMHSTCM